MKDSTTGKNSNSKLWFSIVSTIVLVKYVFANMVIAGMVFGEFDEQGAAMLIGVFGGMYGWRAQIKSKIASDS